MNRRDFLAAGFAGAATLTMTQAAETPRKANLGLLLYSYGQRVKAERNQGFAEPARFLEFAHQRGANAIQVPLGILTEDQATQLRKTSDRLEMKIEGIIAPPKEGAADLVRFTSEMESAKWCGVSVVRTVMLGGRRYEVFDKADEFVVFSKTSEEALKRAGSVAEKQRVALAVENHKDYRVDELVDLLRRLSSEWIGVCLDTGNNLALLDDPHATVDALAPFTRTVHLKDIGVEESERGFLMAEVPLGRGIFDLSRMVGSIRRSNPHVLFQLEMMTRDPLVIPCLTERYWATLPSLPARDLARTLVAVRNRTRTDPLLRVSKLTLEEQLSIEDRHVRESFEFAIKTGLVHS